MCVSPSHTPEETWNRLHCLVDEASGTALTGFATTFIGLLPWPACGSLDQDALDESLIHSCCAERPNQGRTSVR